MADYQKRQARFDTAVGRAATDIDEGLRAYMLRVYNYMAIAVALTGVTALITVNLATSGGQMTDLGYAIYQSPLRWVIMLAPLAFVLVLSFGIQKMSVSTARMMFFLYAAVMGVSISWILLVYTGESVVRTFFISAAAFGALSLYGYSTKRDLSAMGSFLIMGLFGLIIAMLVNMFLQSSAMQFAISAIGVLIFAGLTAWDTQRIKAMYDYVANDETMVGRAAIMGALSLYLDFINLFMFLLHFLGSRD